ncbi:MAG: acyltransferase family protein [Flavobacteriales bacterium]
MEKNQSAMETSGLSKINIPIIVTLRGLAALMVCAYHFVCTTTDYIASSDVTRTFWYGQKGVQVFFIISGIVIPLSLIHLNYKLPQFGKFMLKRFIRIEPPYFASVLLGVFYLYLSSRFGSSTNADLIPSLRDLLLHIGYLIPGVEGAKWINEIYWTLFVEFQYYVVLALTFPLAISGDKFKRMTFMMMMLIPPLFVGSKYFFACWSAFFLIGMGYALWITRRWTTTEFFLSLVLASVVSLYHLPLVDIVFGLATLAVIAFFGNRSFKWGNLLGNFSYSLYLIHSFIGGAFVNFMSHIFREPYQKFLVIAGGIGISLISAYVFYRLIEKPAQAWSRKLA